MRLLLRTRHFQAAVIPGDLRLVSVHKRSVLGEHRPTLPHIDSFALYCPTINYDHSDSQFFPFASSHRCPAVSDPYSPQIKYTVQASNLVMPSKCEIAQKGSVTDSRVLLGLQNDISTETFLTGSDGDDSRPKPSWRKAPILRKKSGELIKPALQLSPARRRPSGIPSKPTCSKAVHFDSHLEHIRNFFQGEKPLSVNAVPSPVEAYDSDTGIFSGEEDNRNDGSLRYKWELVVSSFPADTPERLLLPIRLERVFLSPNNKMLIGNVVVANLAFNKMVIARFTLDYWKTISEVVAQYDEGICEQSNANDYDHFSFSIKLTDQINLEAKTMFFCVKYVVNSQEYWDNNSTNFQINFRKKYKPQNEKKGLQGI